MGAEQAKQIAVPPPLRELEEFYSAAAAPAPVLEMIDGSTMPDPYRSLLVHDGDMTPALEKFHSGSIYLQVLRRKRSHDKYCRDVVLRMEGSNKPIEFGAIEINLDAVCSGAREAILAGRKPLGGILRDFSIPHLSRPKAYFRVMADAVICRALEISNPSQRLYGRRNTLSIPSGAVLAEIIEILPP